VADVLLGSRSSRREAGRVARARRAAGSCHRDPRWRDRDPRVRVDTPRHRPRLSRRDLLARDLGKVLEHRAEHVRGQALRRRAVRELAVVERENLPARLSTRSITSNWTLSERTSRSKYATTSWSARRPRLSRSPPTGQGAWTAAACRSRRSRESARQQAAHRGPSPTAGRPRSAPRASESAPGVESLVPARATVRVGSKAEPRSGSKVL
jgi:hypothetical protein